MGLFDGMSEKQEEKSVLPKEEKKKDFQPKSKNKKGIVDSVIKGNKVIVDVDGNGESIPYNEKEHGHLKKGDILIF